KASQALVVVTEHNTAYNNEEDTIAGHLWGDGAAALLFTKERLAPGDLNVVQVMTGGAAPVGKADEAVTLKPVEKGIVMPFGRDPLLTGGLAPGDTLTTTGKKNPKLSIAGRKAVLTKEEERAAKESEKADQRKAKTPKKKKLFLGERTKKGFYKTGTGKSQEIVIFYYLKTFKQPNPMAPAAFYYNPRKHKIFAANGELDPSADKVLHGPFKRIRNKQVIETGYYAFGTKHLRWERYDAKGGLTLKSHYEMGFPRDANISYYDGGNTMIKEVVPYVNGKLEGD
nr:hypothetical protein [Tanacetum cinerariifolium]